MVKHGRDKKRRAGRIGKTKLKNRTWTRYDPNPKVNSTLRPLWDPSKTPTANLTKLGLVALPNKSGLTESILSDDMSNKNVTSSSAIVELFDVPDSDGLNCRKGRGAILFPMDIDDEKYVVKCMEKYGDNFTRMFRDIKINNMQHTEAKLRKLCTRYIFLTPEQRRMEVPDKVQEVIDQHSQRLNEAF